MRPRQRRRARRSGDVLRRRGRPAAGGGRPVLDPRPRGGPRVRQASGQDGAGRIRARSADRDARLLREATHHRRLEGPDQRPAPGRQLTPSTNGLRVARRLLARRDRARRCRPAPSSSIRSRRSSSPTWSPGARSARAPRRARCTASSPAACRCRSASRTAPTATCRVAIDAHPLEPPPAPLPVA